MACDEHIANIFIAGHSPCNRRKVKIISKYAKRFWAEMKNTQKYVKMIWMEVKFFFTRPWTMGRIVSLLGKILLTVFVLFMVALAVKVSTLPPQKITTADEKIQTYCAAAPEKRVEIQYETRLWMLLNRPENPRVSQGWGFGLTDAQMIALLKLTDGVNPGCPWPPGR